MPAKIIDQFTDLPISDGAKWRLRHPEKHKANSRTFYLTALANPEKYADYWKRRERSTSKGNAKKTMSRVVKRRNWHHSMDKTERLRAEANHHQSKGRDIGQICVWMNLPESKVRELLA